MTMAQSMGIIYQFEKQKQNWDWKSQSCRLPVNLILRPVYTLHSANHQQKSYLSITQWPGKRIWFRVEENSILQDCSSKSQTCWECCAIGWAIGRFTLCDIVRLRFMPAIKIVQSEIKSGEWGPMANALCHVSYGCFIGEFQWEIRLIRAQGLAQRIYKNLWESDKKPTLNAMNA